MSESAKAVFLSYASQDGVAALRICAALRASGIEVWFDQDALVGGDAWDQKIRGQIGTCALFVPVISANTQVRKEGYFRLEWKLAAQRTHMISESTAFLLPVVIDATRDAEADVPTEFRAVQWTRLPGGETSAAFVARVQKLLGGSSAQTATNAPVPPPAPTVAPAARTGLPHWVGIGLGVVVVTLISFLVIRPGAKDVGPAAKLVPEAKPRPVTAPVAVPVVSEKSVAVLAFADMSADKGSEYFSDGISEELLNVLAKVPGLRVAARTSAFFFKGKNLPVPEIAQKLNVAYVVEGSVQRAGERVKITAQLIKAADGFHVWSDTFTRDAKDVFAVQEEIAGRIAKELSLKLGVSSTAATAAVNPEAYELYLQGRQAWNLRTNEGYARAEELLNRALTLQPDFARAISALADVWLNRGVENRGIGRFDQRDSPEMKRILAQIERAVALDPSSAEAHSSLGSALETNWRLFDAAQAQRRAIALNPNYATAHQRLGRTLLRNGYYDEGLAALHRATELDPLSARILDNYAIGLRLFGRYTDALTADERALALQPGSVQAGDWRALDLSGLGRHDEAVAQVRKMIGIGGRSVYRASLISVLIKAGARAEAETLFREISADGDQAFRSLVAMGRPKEALDTMKAERLALSDVGLLLDSPDLDPVRQEPQFVQLLATLGLTEAHARAQKWRAARPLPTAPTKK